MMKIIFLLFFHGILSIKEFEWIYGGPRHTADQIVATFQNVNKYECAVKCFEERFTSNVDFIYIIYFRQFDKCRCVLDSENVNSDNYKVCYIKIDESYDSIGKSITSLKYTDNKVNIGTLYEIFLVQMCYLNYDTTTEIFGIEDLSNPLEISPRVEVPRGIYGVLTSQDISLAHFRRNPKSNYNYNYLKIIDRSGDKAIARTVEFNFFISDMSITTNKTWIVVLTHNEEMVTISIKPIHIERLPKIAEIFLHQAVFVSLNQSVMRRTMALYPEDHCNTDMLNSTLFIEAENSYMRLMLDDIDAPYTAVTDRNDSRITMKWNIHLRTMIWIHFFIIKDDRFNYDHPRKTTVLLNWAYNGYQNDVSKKEIIKRVVKPPLANNGNVKGFYLVDPLTGLRINYLMGGHIKFGYSYDKYRLFNHMLQHDTHRCLDANQQSKRLYLIYCGKSFSKAIQNLFLTLNRPNMKYYSLFEGGYEFAETNVHIADPLVIQDKVQAVYTSFGWIGKSKNQERVNDKMHLTKSPLSYMIKDNGIYFSIARQKITSNTQSYLADIGNGYMHFTDGITILRKFGKRVFVKTVKIGYGVVGYDNYNNCIRLNTTAQQKQHIFKHQNCKHVAEEKLLDTKRNETLSLDNAEQKMNYFEIKNKNTNGTIVMGSINCENEVGKSEQAAMQSCKSIKDYCKTATSGYYWIGGKYMKNIFNVYCEMTIDGGGWMRILHGFVPETPPWDMVPDRTDNVTEWFQSNNTKYLTSPKGLGNLNNYMEFNEIRFYCRSDVPGFVSHFKTLKNERGFAVINYFRNESITLLPHMCYSVHAFEDDNTEMVKNCKYIGPNSDGINGHWSHPDEISKDRRIYKDVYVHKGKSSWAVSQLRCHTHGAKGNTKLQNATFEITVR